MNNNQELVKEWIKIGNLNPWISSAYDPPFSEKSFMFFNTINELAEKILIGSWGLGTAFAFENICFINQLDGGDEWLAIKDKKVLDSITMMKNNESKEAAKERLIKKIEKLQS